MLILDVNNFGIFRADVWGTVSDWVMIVVTALTAWFLYRTLHSQQVVQNLQQDLIAIEKFNHRVKLMPKFKLKISTKPYSLDGDSMTLPFSFGVRNNENIALNAVFTIIDKKNLIQNIDRNPYKYYKVQPDGFFLFSNTLIYEVGFHKGSPVFWISIDLQIQFEDINGNKYLQKFSNMIGASESDHLVISYEPELLS